MNGRPFIIDAIINNTYSISTLIDNGCECFATISDSLVCKAGLARMKVAPRKLSKATNGKD